jgi:hypothetical protein
MTGAMIALDADQLAALDVLATAKKQTREAASHADRTAAHAALREFDRNSKEIREAAALKAKADAKIAKAQADVAVARAEAADAYAAWHVLLNQHGAELRRLRLAAIDRPRVLGVTAQLERTIEAFRQDPTQFPIAHVSKKLVTALTYLRACLDASEDPPEHPEQWLTELLAAFDAAKREAHAQNDQHARSAEHAARKARLLHG